MLDIVKADDFPFPFSSRYTYPLACSALGIPKASMVVARMAEDFSIFISLGDLVAGRDGFAAADREDRVRGLGFHCRWSAGL
jgi:hypothetical protein